MGEKLRTATTALLLWPLCSVVTSAETPDHAAACGLFQLRKEFRRAIKHCDLALHDNREDAATLSNRGSAYLALGKLDQALVDFNAAMQLDPQNPRNYFNRALVSVEAARMSVPVALFLGQAGQQGEDAAAGRRGEIEAWAIEGFDVGTPLVDALHDVDPVHQGSGSTVPFRQNEHPFGWEQMA